MPKYYCEYCDIYLTHSSPAGRRQHATGRKHINQKIEYFQNLIREPGFLPPQLLDTKTVQRAVQLAAQGGNLSYSLTPPTVAAGNRGVGGPPPFGGGFAQPTIGGVPVRGPPTVGGAMFMPHPRSGPHPGAAPVGSAGQRSGTNGSAPAAGFPLGAPSTAAATGPRGGGSLMMRGAAAGAPPVMGAPGVPNFNRGFPPMGVPMNMGGMGGPPPGRPPMMMPPPMNNNMLRAPSHMSMPGGPLPFNNAPAAHRGPPAAAPHGGGGYGSVGLDMNEVHRR